MIYFVTNHAKSSPWKSSLIAWSQSNKAIKTKVYTEPPRQNHKSGKITKLAKLQTMNMQLHQIQKKKKKKVRISKTCRENV